MKTLALKVEKDYDSENRRIVSKWVLVDSDNRDNDSLATQYGAIAFPDSYGDHSWSIDLAIRCYSWLRNNQQTWSDSSHDFVYDSLCTCHSASKMHEIAKTMKGIETKLDARATKLGRFKSYPDYLLAMAIVTKTKFFVWKDTRSTNSFAYRAVDCDGMGLYSLERFLEE